MRNLFTFCSAALRNGSPSTPPPAGRSAEGTPSVFPPADAPEAHGPKHSDKESRASETFRSSPAPGLRRHDIVQNHTRIPFQHRKADVFPCPFRKGLHRGSAASISAGAYPGFSVSSYASVPAHTPSGSPPVPDIRGSPACGQYAKPSGASVRMRPQVHSEDAPPADARPQAPEAAAPVPLPVCCSYHLSFTL